MLSIILEYLVIINYFRVDKIERFIYKNILVVKMAEPNKSVSDQGVIGAYYLDIPGYMGALTGNYHFTVEVDPNDRIMWVGSESLPYHHFIQDEEGNLIGFQEVNQHQIGQILRDVMSIKGKVKKPLEQILKEDKELIEKIAADVKAYKPPG